MNEIKKPKLLILAIEMQESNALIHFLEQQFEIVVVIFEEKIAKKQLIRGRVRKLGWWKVLGQLFFQVLIQIPMRKFSQTRISQIIQFYQLDVSPVENKKIVRVRSVNDSDCIEKMKALAPDIIFVAGTRIIAKKVLLALPKTPFVNLHAGITPAYRGVHGAYWANYQGDMENCGLTVHLVDAGIDTGKVLKQKKITPQKNDNFCTYPWIQLGESLSVLSECLQEIFEQKHRPFQPNLPSQLWYHPTIWQYLWGIWKGKK